jgi:hypothetical protein
MPEDEGDKMLHKIEIRVDQTHHDKLEKLKNSGGISGWRELCNQALDILAWAIERVSEGYTIMAVKDENGEMSVREIKLESLEHVAENRTKDMRGGH